MFPEQACAPYGLGSLRWSISVLASPRHEDWLKDMCGPHPDNKVEYEDVLGTLKEKANSI